MEKQKQWNSTLSRKTPMKKGGKFKRTSALRSKPIRNREAYISRKPVIQSKPLRNESEKLKKVRKKYYPVQREFLKRPENKFCWICIARRTGLDKSQIMEAAEAGQLHEIAFAPATEVHHFAGRIGRLLDFVPFFIPECLECRPWPHDNPREARKLGVLAMAPEWNVYPANAAEIRQEYERFTSSFKTKMDA